MLKRFKEIIFNYKRFNIFIYYIRLIFDIFVKLQNKNEEGNDVKTALSEHQIINLCNARDMARDTNKIINKRIDFMMQTLFFVLIISSLIFICFENQLNFDTKALLSSIIGFCYDMIKCIIVFEVGGGISNDIDNNDKATKK